MDRSSKIERNSFETKISLSLNLDGEGKSNIKTGVGFFDHMMTHISKHGFLDLDLNCVGDIEVDCHHTIEDCGIVFGKAIKEALGERVGIKRYGQCIMPMEEALVICAIDISSRPLLCFDCDFTVEKIGDMATEMVEEFFRAVSVNSGLNIHIKVLSGKNNHHIAEAIFKAFGRTLADAVSFDKRVKGVLSTKGMMD